MNLARATSRDSQLSLSLWVCHQAYPDRLNPKEWELFVNNFMGSSDGSMVLSQLGKLPDCMPKEAQLKLAMLLQLFPDLRSKLQLEKDYIWRGFIEAQADDVLRKL